MRITAITQQKRDSSRYNIFIDGVYAFALPMQDILYFKLKEGAGGGGGDDCLYPQKPDLH